MEVGFGDEVGGRDVVRDACCCDGAARRVEVAEEVRGCLGVEVGTQKLKVDQRDRREG